MSDLDRINSMSIQLPALQLGTNVKDVMSLPFLYGCLHQCEVGFDKSFLNFGFKPHLSSTSV